jgi:putative ABC transport system ATP-binding protein
MVTHNLKQAVSIGNRTLMMANGHIVVDLTGDDRRDLTIQDLMRMFKEQAGKEFDNDRILLSE